MVDTLKRDFDNIPTSKTFVQYSGNIISCVVRGVGKNTCVVTDVLLDSTAGYRLFSVSVSTGQKLYRYIDGDGRYNRMGDIQFTFNVLLERQLIMDYIAYDKGEYIGTWIGDALSREKV